MTYTEVQGSDDCVAGAPNGNIVPLTCTPQATITALKIEGQRVFPVGTQVLAGTQVPLTNIPIVVNGVPLTLNGTLTIGESISTGFGTPSASVEFMPLHLTGQACPSGLLGCLSGYLTVDIRDDVFQTVSLIGNFANGEGQATAIGNNSLAQVFSFKNN